MQDAYTLPLPSERWVTVTKPRSIHAVTDALLQRQQPVKETVGASMDEEVGGRAARGTLNARTGMVSSIRLSADICELSDCVTGYVHFYEESAVPKATIKIYSNNKPWVTKEIKNKIKIEREGEKSLLRG